MEDDDNNDHVQLGVAQKAKKISIKDDSNDDDSSSDDQFYTEIAKDGGEDDNDDADPNEKAKDKSENDDSKKKAAASSPSSRPKRAPKSSSATKKNNAAATASKKQASQVQEKSSKKSSTKIMKTVYKRPKGRAPKDSTWDENAGKWIPIDPSQEKNTTAGGGAPSVSAAVAPAPKKSVKLPRAAKNAFAENVAAAKKAGLIPRPLGAPKKGCEWDPVGGVWIPISGQATAATATGGGAGSRTPPLSSPAKRASSKTNNHSHNGASPVARKRAKKSMEPKPSPLASSSMTNPHHHQHARLKPSEEAKAAREKIVMLARFDLWSTEESTLVEALNQLTAFCEDETEDAELCRQALLETGVHALVVKVLERNPNSAVLQGKGLETLFHFSASSLVVVEEALLVMGAVEAALLAMQKFPDDAQIQMFACVLLGNLINSLETWESVQKAAIRISAPSSEDDDHPPEAVTNEETEGETEKDDEKEESAAGKRGDEENGDDSSKSKKTQNALLKAVFAAIDSHTDNERTLEAAVFLLERCLKSAGRIMVDLLTESAPYNIGALLVAHKKFGDGNPNLSKGIRTFFEELSRNL